MPCTLQRPTLHFTPQRGWINDPNGLLWDGTRYHLFAQHNPYDVVWGPMHWLHATSNDMLHWREDGIALYPDELGTMFSGSAIQLPDGRIALMYTAHGEYEQQCVAFSEDGFHFNKHGANPVIPNARLKDFRDPKLFCNHIDGGWSIVVAAGEHVEFYHSDDMIAWRKTGAFAPEDRREGELFECPDLIFLRTPEGEPVAVLTASMIYPDGTEACRMKAFLGIFDGATFWQTQEKPLRLDVGYDSYAGVTMAGLDEPILMNWMSSTSCPLPTEGYCGCLSLPRRLSLVHAGEMLCIAQIPVLPSLAWKRVEAVLPASAFVLHLCAEGPFAMELLDGTGVAALRIALDRAGFLCTERRRSREFAPDGCYNQDGRRITRVPRTANGPLEVTMICDSYCVELFADGGTYAHGLLLFSEGPLTRVRYNGVNRLELAQLL